MHYISINIPIIFLKNHVNGFRMLLKLQITFHLLTISNLKILKTVIVSTKY